MRVAFPLKLIHGNKFFVCTQTWLISISLKGIQADTEDPKVGEDEDVHEYITSREEWMAISAMAQTKLHKKYI